MYSQKEGPTILRKALLPICLVIILASAQSAQAEFAATFTMTSTAADPAHVFPLTPITVTVWDAQSYGTTPLADDSITRIQLNWENSSTTLSLTTGSTWTWNSTLLSGILAYNDSDMSDGLVACANGGGDGIVPGTYFSLGTLAFTAPAYTGGVNTHALDLNGGLVDEETVTLVACGAPAALPPDTDGVWLMAFPNGEGLTLNGYNITIVPGGYWTGATDTQWQIGTNWSSQMTPDYTFEAVFDGALTTQPALMKGEAVKSVEFRTGGWNIGEPTYTLTVGAGGITSAGSSTNTIQPTVALDADAAITVTGASHILQMAAISADGHSVSKEGAGTLKATDVTADVFNVNGGAAEITSLTGSGSNRTASVAAGKSLTVSSAISNLALLTINGTLAGTSTIGADATNVGATGILSGTSLSGGGLSVANGGRATFSGAATMTGTLDVSGTVTVGATSQAGTFNLNAGGTANVTGGLNGTGAGAATLASGSTFTATGATNMTGWTIAALNTGVNLNGGALGANTVNVGATVNAGATTANAFNVNAGGTANIGGLVNAGSTTVYVGGQLTADSHSGTDLTVHGTANYTTSANLSGKIEVGNGLVPATLTASTIGSATVAGELSIKDKGFVQTAFNGTADETSKVTKLTFDMVPGLPPDDQHPLGHKEPQPLGQLDLRMGKFIIEYSPTTLPGEVEEQVRILAQSGYEGRGVNGNLYWDGNGIISSDAATDPTYLHAFALIDNRGGYLDESDPENPVWVEYQLFPTWGGESVTASSILGMYTYIGDANMDGEVNTGDYGQIDNGFNSGLTGWWNGDFNYDGVVDTNDYGLIDNAYNTLHPDGGVGGGVTELGAVPEPATLGLMALGLAAMAARRRRSK
jgi:hypothetical protein